MANVIYNEFLHLLLSQSINLATDSLKVALMVPEYTPNPDSQYFSEISGSEIVGDGYAAGGVALTGVILTKQDDANNVKITANPVTWPASTLTTRYAVIYKDSGDSETSPLVLCFDFGVNRASVNGNFTINWSDAGIATLSQAT